VKKLIIIEDDLPLAELIQDTINELPDYSCDLIFTEVNSFLNYRGECDIILLDIVLPGITGLDAIPMILDAHPTAGIVMNSIKDDSESIFKALQLGAIGYIDKQSFELNFREVFESLDNGGAYMTPKIARKVIRFFQQSKRLFEQLTTREKDIVNGILKGSSYQEIAENNQISINTVRTNIKRIDTKLQINSKGELLHIFRKL
jgi:DNA-binding NarL/FixJ family response regulator